MADSLAAERLKWLRGFLAAGTAMPAAAPAVSASPAAFGPTPPRQPAPPPDPAAERAKTALTSRFRVKVGANGGATWKASELQPVSDAFAAIPEADKPLLQGVEVDRVPAIGNSTDAAAVYEAGVDPTTRPPAQVKKLKVADAAYVDTSSGRPQVVSPAEQKRKVVHEVGHIIAKQGQIDADLARANAAATFNDAVAARDRALANQPAASAAVTAASERSLRIFNQPRKDAAQKAALAQADADLHAAQAAQKTIDDEVAARRAAVAAAKTPLDAATSAAAATRVPKATVDAGQAQVDASGTAAGTAAGGATAATARMSTAEQNESLPYRNASNDVGGTLAAYTNAIKNDRVGPGSGQRQVGDWDGELEAKVKARNTARQALQARAARNPALAAFAAIDRAQDDWVQKVETQARLKDRTPKIQEFVDVVTRNHIPPMSPYAAQSWPAKPEEFYAEAYSYFVTDPRKLRSHSPDLFNWFAGGHYR